MSFRLLKETTAENLGAPGTRRTRFTEPEGSNGTLPAHQAALTDLKSSTASTRVGLMWFHNVNILLMKGVINMMPQLKPPPSPAPQERFSFLRFINVLIRFT